MRSIFRTLEAIFFFAIYLMMIPIWIVLFIILGFSEIFIMGIELFKEWRAGR